MRVQAEQIARASDQAGAPDSVNSDVSSQICNFRLSRALSPYFTSLYWFSIKSPRGAYLRDYFPPECASLRFVQDGRRGQASIVPGDFAAYGPIAVSGPTSRAIRVALPEMRFVSFGLRPAGWARFVQTPASEFANSVVDGTQPDFALFTPLLGELCAAGADPHAAAQRIDACLLELHERMPPAPPLVLACQDALSDPNMCEVDHLCERVGTSRRTLERLCVRYFAFAPKTLLRRQRFLRSLGRFMTDTRDTWSAALDTDYFDQAHFVRDFRSFMGITPSEFAEMPHPLLDKIIAQRMADQGALPGREAMPAGSRCVGADTGGVMRLAV